MDYERNQRCINIKTGEFGIFQQAQTVVTASGETYQIYEIILDEESSRRRAWKAEDIAPWAKPNRSVSAPAH